MTCRKRRNDVETAGESLTQDRLRRRAARYSTNGDAFRTRLLAGMIRSSVGRRLKAVGPVPVGDSGRKVDDDIDSGGEPGERADSIRDCTQALARGSLDSAS